MALGQDSDIIEGVVYAADAGADVILMSFSNPGYSSALQAAIDYAWASGAVLVAAAGNDGSRPPPSRPATAASSASPRPMPPTPLPPPSNYGAVRLHGRPRRRHRHHLAGGTVATISGTSASAAMVAGAAALLRANEPALSNGVIVAALPPMPIRSTARPGNGRLNLAARHG